MVYTCMDIGFKNNPEQVLTFLQEDTLTKDFALFHIKFYPQNLL